MKLNNKGQFSIIAALLVAAVLISAVVVTYSSIRYSAVDNQPQILSSIDETNLGLKEILGFTVGYYGSVLKVTGNMTYAQQLATNYLKSGLGNMGDVQPEWGAVFSLQSLQLNASWFSANSYSQGSLVVNYNLTGLGIYGASYNASARLNVQVLNSSSANQAQLVILRDGGEPLINLGKSNLQFYRYDYSASAWSLVEPAAIASYANGTYVLDLPSGVNGAAYVIQINDNRGLMVLASSYTQFTSKVAWNTTGFSQTPHYVDDANMLVGSDTNFYDQQTAPDGNYDTLSEQAYGFGQLNYYPQSINPLGSTTVTQNSGNITVDTDSNDHNYLWLHSYPSAFSGTATVGYTTAETGSTVSINNYIRGSVFTTGNGGQAETISAYLTVVSRTATVKAAIYTTGGVLVGATDERTTAVTTGAWVTFTFSTKPFLNANTNYILVVWGRSGGGSSDVLIGRTSAANQGYYESRTYAVNWLNPDTNLNINNYKYSIYCNYTQATQYTAQAEFNGISDTMNWQQLTWTTITSVTAGTANLTLKLYNATAGTYPIGGDGYINSLITTSDSTQTQIVTSNPLSFRNASTGWKLLIFAQNASSAQFDLKIDLVQLTTRFTNYAINLQEQFLIVNASNPRQDLCIKTGSFSNEALIVQVLREGEWVNLMTLQPNFFNNITLIPYIDSTNLAIRFVGANDQTDNTPSTFAIDSVYIKDEPDVAYFISRQQSTFTIELLQNGTMRWLGQNLEVSTQTIPVPPVPVKAIHVNQTINGINREVSFQLEDWASNYQIPLGLSSNTTVFGNRQMIVILLDSGVSDFTVWWDGNDNATQTPLAYTGRYFTADNPELATLTNGNLTLVFSGGTLKSTVAGTGTYSTTTFMRINGQASAYGAGWSYVISGGVIRDVVMQESEWNGGIANCPNVYANIIVTLPANSTYFTYSTRLMFITSNRDRSVANLCPINVNSSITGQAMTENGTQADYPIIFNGTKTYPNYGGSTWTEHHFSQIITANNKGAGIMFTDRQNLKLYAFDSIVGEPTGALSPNTSASQIELLPVTLASVSFNYAYDVAWQGAVATFDGQTPVCSLYDATTPYGLWILAETPPTLTVVAKS